MPLNLDVSGGPFVIFAVVAMIATAVVHIALAIAVLSDANSLGTRTTLVGPIIWALATLLGGIVAAAAYWAMNRSILTPLYATQALRTIRPEPPALDDSKSD